MSRLTISETLKLPVDVTTQALAFLGRRGSGKSYAATKLAELLHAAGAQFVAIDPVGIWWGLRLAADGRGGGLDVPIFGGLHGDIPLAATAGALIADVIADRGISTVLDVSQFESEADKARFARDFAARFFYRKKSAPSAVHLFVEEAQEFIPQNIQRGEEQMLHAFQRMIRLGRNYGIGVSMISQRPQDVNKKALNQAECLFCFQLTGPQERKAVEGWVSDKGLADDLSRLLPDLKIGHAHVWSPVWLDVNEEVLIAEKQTFAAGSTPKVGARPVEMKPLAPIELEKIERDMAATIEQAKANDPAVLRRRIVELEKKLAARPKEQVEKVVEKIVEVPVLKNGQLDRTEKILGRLQAFADKTLAETAELRRLIAPASAPRPAAALVTPAATIVRPAPAARVAPAAGAVAEGLSQPEQAILDTVLMLEARGIPASRDAVARWLGIHPNGGRYGSNLGRLRSDGYLDGFSLTDLGRRTARPTATGVDAALAALPDEPKRKILRTVLGAGRPLSRDELAAELGIHPNGGRFGSDLGWLRTMGLLPERGAILATDAVMR
jgi:hypothetical protein